MRGKSFLPDFWKTLTFILVLVFALFLVYPLASLFLSSFKAPETHAWTLDNFAKFFSRKFYYSALGNSFLVTACVTVLTVFIGIPMAYFMTAFKIRGKTVLEILIIISMMSPAFIGAYSWVLLGGRNGVLTKFIAEVLGLESTPSIYGFGGILLVFTLKLYPFIYMYASGALKKIDVSLGEAAESLGCGGLRKVATIIVPLITPTILAGSLLVFMNALADFGTPMLIGEGFRTMPVLIYSEFVGEVGGSANFAASMATIMVLITALMFIAQKHFVNKKSYTMSALRPMQPKEITGIKSFFVHAFLFVVIGLSIIPQLTVIYTSFLNTNQAIFLPGFSLVSYKMIFSNLGNAIANTYLFGLLSILAIVLLGLFIAYLSVRRRNFFTGVIDTLTMFPYIIPGSVLGITLLLAFNDKPLILSGTALIIIISLVIRRLPYTLRSSSAILYQISPSIEEASISLGASPVMTFFRITAVMMLPGVLSGAILSWITVINELSSSVILYTAGTRTMSVAVYQEVVRASYGTAAALATILTATTVVSLIVFYKLTGKKEVSV
ncbi:MAG: iron ABC transporter permease [Spirochaetales bacterium]|jgi:iron(III) transport system permease protein|nr:iron ABC transporter permease [Spirochaetales bacterium]